MSRSLRSRCRSWSSRKKHGTAAWLIRRRLTASAATPYPALAKLPNLSKLLAAYRDLATTYRAEKLPLTASYITAAHNRLAALLHTEQIEAALKDATERERIAQVITHRQALRTSGWTEDDLIGYANSSGSPRFFEAPNLDLHVGRSEPPKSTGLDGKSPHRPVFVRSRNWQAAGRYHLGTDVYFTTPLAEGALIIGHTRRDRALKIEFSAGDFRISNDGKRKRRPEWNSVNISIDSGFVRNDHLPGQAPLARHDFDSPKPAFRLDVIVDGASLRVFVDKAEIMSYVTPNGLALDGYVGFAMRRGAVRLVDTTLERLDWGLQTRAPGIVTAFSLAIDGDRELSEYRNCKTRGMPLSKAGSFVLVIPSSDRLAKPSRLASASVAALAHATKDLKLEQVLALAVPASTDKETQKAPLAAMQERFGDRGRVFVHGRTSMPEDLPVILFLDAQGILRFSRSFPPADDKMLSHSIKHWAMAYRAPR